MDPSHFVCQPVLAADKDSCEVTSLTVQIVEDCPITAEKWEVAAARKNCAEHAIWCDEPKRLEYHCVINPFVNQTLEVCAYVQNIGLGQCTEYNIGGNLLQPNKRAICSSLLPIPCPLTYPSKEAFKYPGCYQLTKKANTSTNRTNTPSIDSLPTTPSSDLPGNEEKESTGQGKSCDVFSIILLLIFVKVVVNVVVS